MKKWISVSRTAMIAGMTGAGAMALFIFGPQFPEARARPLVVESPSGAPLSFADLIEQTSPAVVGIRSQIVIVPDQRSRQMTPERFFEQFGLVPRPGQPVPRERFSQGSGFFISEDGYIVTNSHVVENATEIEITMHDGEKLSAELVGVDLDTDLAVLKVSKSGKYTHVDFGASSMLRPGDWVIALGSPFGFSGTATAGIISAIGKPGDNFRSGSYTDYLQIDAAINRGNSGGPTFDLTGRVVGVNTWIASPTSGSVGIGFAIPSELAADVIQTLITTGKVSRGYLGVMIGDVTDEIASSLGLETSEGAIVSTVMQDSPAARYGLQRGDIIIGLNGQSIGDAISLTRLVGALEIGSSNTFEIMRDGNRKTVKVTVGERQNTAVNTTIDENKTLGATLRPIDGQIREQFSLDPDETGMIITSIEPDGLLYKAGLRGGMLILDVNSRQLTDLSVLEEELEAARTNGRNHILMAVHDSRRVVFVTVEIGEDD